MIPKDDKTFYPSTFATWFGWLSLAVFTGMSLVLIWQRIVPSVAGLFGG